MNNNLIIIENGQLDIYMLDDRLLWEMGRPTKGNNPDIKLYSSTVSRRHGAFQNMDGIWFYLDYNGKNGTVYNNKQIKAGLNGRIRPIMLKNGDVFIFGARQEAAKSCKPVWAVFSTNSYSARWRVEDTKEMMQLKLKDGDSVTQIDQPEKGTMVETDHGIAIYMGDVTYLVGDTKLICNNTKEEK
ncbi:MAG: FHA domain-containing protein [Tyzzerella sp.]|nr:FHA domain-containing protein [Tyzzerella sp.]